MGPLPSGAAFFMPEIYTYETDAGEVEVRVYVKTFASSEDAEDWLASHYLSVTVIDNEPQRLH